MIMIVTRITYRRTFNLGNYESETIEMTADIDTDESVADTMEKLKVMVHNQSTDNSRNLETGSVRY